ncbi:MAG: response regulator [Alphaproteobacteria bacterium]|nr:response regulator [Alphaproteobacteria bacterium]
MLGALVVLTVLLGALTTFQLHTQARLRAVQHQQEVLDRLQDLLDEELLRRQEATRALAARPELIAATLALLETPTDALLGSPALAELRELMDVELAREGDLGIFLIREDGVSIASMHDSNVGTPNFLTRERPELIAQAWSGETVLLPPVRSDIELHPPVGPALPAGYPTAFLATPVRVNGRVVAVFTIRTDAARFFSPVSQASFGQTGEVLAFDAQSRLASASRFAPQLRQDGLVAPGESEVATLRISLPEGTPLPAGGAAREGVVVKPYRNYRGAQVISAWCWDPVLGVGLLAEQEDREVTAEARRLATVMGTVGAAVTLMLLLASGLNLRREQSFQPLVGLVLAMAALTIGGVSVVTVRELRRDAMLTAERDAHLLAQQTHRVVELWLQERVDEVSRLGRDPNVGEAAAALMALPPEQRSGSAPMEALRATLAPTALQRGDIGFELIDPAGRCVSVLSLDTPDAPCVLPSVSGEALSAVLAGAERLIPDLPGSEVPGSRAQGLRSVYAVAPVTAPGEDPKAALALRIDPRGRLTFLTTGSRLGRSSETFLVNADGCLLSEPRMWSGPVSASEPRPILRTPDAQPTFAALELMSGRSGSSVDPYLSYHGQPVVGAWIWDGRLQLGVVSEIGEAEVSAQVGNHARLLLMVNLLALVALTLGGVLLVVATQESQRREVDELAEARRLAEQANLSKDALVANVSHELRTPMNGVIGMIELLLRSAPRPEQREHLRVMRESADTLLHVINDLLHYSKLSGGYLQLERAPYPLVHLLERVVRMARPMAAEAGDTLELELDASVPRYVLGDSVRLQQVLTNLLSNAIKFTEGGRVTLRVAPAEGDRLRFEVEDTGIGIAEDKQALIFEAFVQSDASTTRRFGGTGLGLPISAHLVSAMGGTLEVRSQLGEGSVFSFSLSLPASEAPAGALSPSPLRGSGAPRRLLLAEDNPINQRVAVAILESVGHTVTVVPDGTEAVEAALQGGFDLVLMDMQMLHMDGMEATTRIRAVLGPDTLPIVAVTAMGRESERAQALAVGMQEVLVKPYSADALLSVVRRWARGPEVLDLDGLREEWRVIGAEHEVPELLEDFITELDALEATLREAPDPRSEVASLQALADLAREVRAFPLHQALDAARAARLQGDLQALPELDEAMRGQLQRTRRAVQDYLNSPASR